ncbi:MAG: hypothetical protein J5I98_34095 [Phaeodactylibacter sp.]|nr:hypothetical protein [Phaeodactylibacter sp.]
MSKLAFLFCFCTVALLAFVAPFSNGEFEAGAATAADPSTAHPINGTGYHQIEAAIDGLALAALDNKKIPGMTIHG